MIHNYRLNPYTNVMESIDISGEKHVIPTTSPYTVRLIEVPRKDSPTTIQVQFSDGGILSEVSSTPAAGQYFPDYLTTAHGLSDWNTGTLLFNAADAGKTITVSYKGIGTLTDDRLENMLEMTFTGSKQANINLTANLALVNSSLTSDETVTGIAAGTKSLHTIIQELVDMSHTHKQKRLSFNCNCDCACCFIAGTLVTLADGTTKPIELLRSEDAVLGMNGSVNMVKGLHHVKLGSQRTMMTFADRSVTFTGDHVFRIRTKFGTEGWGVCDVAGFLREHDLLRANLKEVFPITEETEYCKNGEWLMQKPIIAREYGDETECYDLILDGDSTYYANGYLVKAYTEGFDD